MEYISDEKQFKNIIHKLKADHGRLEKNSILLPQTIRKYIDHHQMLLKKYDDGVGVFIDEGNYYNLFLYWQEGKPLEDFRQKKPVLVELLNNGKNTNDNQSDLRYRLIKAGACLFKTNLQVETDLITSSKYSEELVNEDKKRLDEMGLQAVVCKNADTACLVYDLWDEYLDPTDIPAEHKVYSSEEQLLYIKNKEGGIAATNWWKTSGRVSEGRHTVTIPAYYRKGIASAMLRMWCLDARRAGATKAFTWISDNNTKSLGLYEKIGFLPNSRVSSQYIID